MKLPDWGSLLRAVQKAADDIKANRPPPPPVGSGDLADMLDQINAQLPAIITALRSHQGVLTAADDILAVLSEAGVTWATTADNAVLTAPGAFASAQKWLPMLIWELSAFHPAATGIQGDGPRVGRG